MSTKLIDDITIAASGNFTIGTDNDVPTTITATGLGASETVDIMFSQDGGATFTDMWIDGTQIQLSQTNNTLSLYVFGIFKVDKSVTSGGVTVTAHKKGDI